VWLLFCGVKRRSFNSSGQRKKVVSIYKDLKLLNIKMFHTQLHSIFENGLKSNSIKNNQKVLKFLVKF
jgi:hypothetical protein